jgi:hypothetical protein
MLKPMNKKLMFSVIVELCMGNQIDKNESRPKIEFLPAAWVTPATAPPK